MTEETPKVAILMGSISDLDVMSHSCIVLNQYNIPHIEIILSAHRTPELVKKFVRDYEKHVVAFICGAGMAAHLAGNVAAYTTVPVLGVPIDSGPFHGHDALLSTVQMPKGVPVATFAVGKAGAINAAFFAISMLAYHDHVVRLTLEKSRKDMEKGIIDINKKAGLADVWIHEIGE